MSSDVLLRPATANDADGIGKVYLASRKHFLPHAPLAHTDTEVCQWVVEHLLHHADVTVAVSGSEIVGMMALTRDGVCGWIDQLYLHPQMVGRGIGSRLVEQAKSILGSPIQLYTFQQNVDARRFYERHGFKAIEFGDGSQNEEKCPDVLYEWRQG